MNCKKMSKKVAKGLKKVVRKCVQKSRKGARDMSAESRVGTPCRLRRKRVKHGNLRTVCICIGVAMDPMGGL